MILHEVFFYFTIIHYIAKHGITKGAYGLWEGRHLWLPSVQQISEWNCTANWSPQINNRFISPKVSQHVQSCEQGAIWPTEMFGQSWPTTACSTCEAEPAHALGADHCWVQRRPHTGKHVYSSPKSAFLGFLRESMCKKTIYFRSHSHAASSLVQCQTYLDSCWLAENYMERWVPFYALPFRWTTICMAAQWWTIPSWLCSSNSQVRRRLHNVLELLHSQWYWPIGQVY